MGCQSGTRYQVIFLSWTWTHSQLWEFWPTPRIYSSWCSSESLIDTQIMSSHILCSCNSTHPSSDGFPFKLLMTFKRILLITQPQITKLYVISYHPLRTWQLKIGGKEEVGFCLSFKMWFFSFQGPRSRSYGVYQRSNIRNQTANIEGRGGTSDISSG